MKNVVTFGTMSDDAADTAAVDVSTMTGKLVIGASASFTDGTNPAATYKVQTCATSDGTYTDVAHVSRDSAMVVDSRDCLKYVHVHATITGSPTAAVVAAAIAGELAEL